MLELVNIKKDYPLADDVVHALKGVSIKFRESEFVSILGPSGCGKTTLLNIIGGLDQYTEGDLIINGVSTKEYGDKDWDTYRNHSIGFVFQSYNLIPHQTVLENVEIALTLSGVSKKERKERATEALKKVGLGDKLKSRPNQLSGGQMQRVAIARALVNDPDILLADEPTGALDSGTSVQIMELLKEIAKDRLIIMVTHNPSLAEEYSTRIVRMLDGVMMEDTNPIVEDEKVEITQEEQSVKVENTYARQNVEKAKKTSMSFLTALSLSFKNLMTKKTRTFLTSFAGSIGIIGIALVLSISSGFQAYIDRVQKDTLSNYPITITAKSADMGSILTKAMEKDESLEEYPDDETITGNSSLADIFQVQNEAIVTNDLKSFKQYMEAEDTKIDSSKISAIQYGYNVDFDVYLDGQQINMFNFYTSAFGEMIDNTEFIRSQYDLIGESSRWNDPSNAGEAILVVDKYNQISDVNLLNLGIKNKDSYNLAYQMTKANYKDMTLDAIKLYMSALVTDPTLKAEINALTDMEQFYKWYVKYSFGFTEEDITRASVSFTELLGKSYTVLPYGEKFYVDDGTYNKGDIVKSYNTTQLSEKIENDELNAFELEIVGIVRLKEEVATGSITASLAYPKAFTEKLISIGADNQFVQAQLADTSYNVLNPTGSGAFTYTQQVFDKDTMSFKDVEVIDTVEDNLEKLGYADLDSPTSISIYPVSFEDKDYISDYVNKYNDGVEDAYKITYTDYLGIMMSSISTIINAISYVLIGFVSVSLVVSSIMIGIITYISVLERIKEIGILRAVGASKKDISRVFTAETLIIGFVSGIIGIGVTLLLTIPINLILKALAGIANVAQLPVVGALILVLISMLLTFIAGLIPSKIAAKKDPVEALRSE